MYYIEGLESKETIDRAKKKIAYQIIDEIYNTNDDFILLKINIPKTIPLYKDTTMSIENCCYSYIKIDPRYITKIKL